jgi:spore maturation protein CgeB
MKIVILGLSITSSWGNGHATTYRSLVRALHARGHEVLFLERDVPWYASNRDLPKPPFGTTLLYESVASLKEQHAAALRAADAVIVGSYVPDGCEVGEWVVRTAHGVRAFYDIDTPITLANLRKGDATYLSPCLVREYDLYLSFTGGPTLRRIEQEFGARQARALYCSVDASLYYPERVPIQYGLGYLGTYSDDRQPALEELLLKPARKAPSERFIVAGPQYPASIEWPANVERVEHVAPHAHRAFYASQRFTLNVTRVEMIRAGYSPSVRLFEAAASATPIISDAWPGLESVLTPGREVLVARCEADVESYLAMDEAERLAIGERARARILAEHTAEHRAAELELYIEELRASTLLHARIDPNERSLLAAQ